MKKETSFLPWKFADFLFSKDKAKLWHNVSLVRKSWTKAFEETIPRTCRANSYAYWMHAPGTMTDVCVANFIFINSTIGSATNVVNS